MERQHNIVECDICELSDHLESMQKINGKLICGTCFDTYRKVRDIISAKQKNHKARKLSDSLKKHVNYHAPEGGVASRARTSLDETSSSV